MRIVECVNLSIHLCVCVCVCVYFSNFSRNCIYNCTSLRPSIVCVQEVNELYQDANNNECVGIHCFTSSKIKLTTSKSDGWKCGISSDHHKVKLRILLLDTLLLHVLLIVHTNF